MDEFDIDCAPYWCPLCEKKFSVYNPNEKYGNEWAEKHIEECDYPDVYKGCLTKKEVWK